MKTDKQRYNPAISKPKTPKNKVTNKTTNKVTKSTSRKRGSARVNTLSYRCKKFKENVKKYIDLASIFEIEKSI